MKTIIIHEEYKDDYVTRPAGERLRIKIIELAKQERVILDFSNKKVASVSFLDEALGKLVLEGWDLKTFREKIKIKDLYKFDAVVLEKILKDRGLS